MGVNQEAIYDAPALQSTFDLMRNLYPSRANPFENTGANCFGKKFRIMAYDWRDDVGDDEGDENTLSNPNFEWVGHDFRACWYKHCGRGLEINRSLTQDELTDMAADYIDEIARAR
jgi:hypothetical protein